MSPSGGGRGRLPLALLPPPSLRDTSAGGGHKVWTFRSTNGGSKDPPYIKAEGKDRERSCDLQVIATVPYNQLRD